jgi:hypothetical protein
MLVCLTTLNQWIQCGVNHLDPHAGRENFSALFELQSSIQKKREELGFFLRCPKTVGHRATREKKMEKLKGSR